MDPEIRDCVHSQKHCGRYGSHSALSCPWRRQVLGCRMIIFAASRPLRPSCGGSSWTGAWVAGARGARTRRLTRSNGCWSSTARAIGTSRPNFHEHLVRDHGFRLGYTWTKIRLQEAGACEEGQGARGAPQEAAAPLPGMLLFQDENSPHRWRVDLGRASTWIATMDDATGEVVSAFAGRGRRHLLELSRASGNDREEAASSAPLYTARGSHYSTAHQGRRQGRQGAPDPGRPGPRPELGIEHIPSYSPPGGASSGSSAPCKGACPRSCVWPASPPVDEANRYIAETFLPALQ